MGESIVIPLWLAVTVMSLAAWAVLDRFLLPCARWFLCRRINRVLAEINTRLDLKIQSFKLTQREVLIDRLTYDPDVMDAVAQKKALPVISRARS